MRTKHDLDQAFRDAKREADDPLMSRETVLALLAANPIASSPVSTTSTSTSIRRTSRTPWIVGGSLALAATVALVAVNLWDTDSTPLVKNGVDGPLAVAPSERIPGNSELREGRGADHVSQAPSDLASNDVGESDDPPVESAPNPLSIATIQLSADMLAPFGISYANNSISYLENGKRVTIRANGIASKVDGKLKADRTIAPVMVVVYHDEQHHARWWNAEDPIQQDRNNRSASISMNSVASINGMIAIRIPLQARDVLASKVDVVLWFMGTEEVAALLPAPYREQVLSELGITQATTNTHYTQTDATSSSLVIASKVMPNPLRSGLATIRMQLKKAAVSTGIIMDMFGKEVAVAWKSVPTDEGSADFPLFGLENAPSGVYNVVVTFEGSQERIVQRLMIQR